MIIPDANLLLYTYDSSSPFHRRSAAWWSECLSGDESVGLISNVLFAFVRIATSSRAFVRPLRIEEATARVVSWLEQPNVQLLEMRTPDVRQAFALLNAAGAGGNLTTDAQIAAISLREGAVVHTGDSDYARFASVRWYNPITGKRHP